MGNERNPFECQIRLEHIKDMPILSIDIDDPKNFTFETLLHEIGRLTCLERNLDPTECIVDDIVTIKYCNPQAENNDDTDDVESWICIYGTHDLQRAIGTCTERRYIEVSANIVVSPRNGGNGGDDIEEHVRDGRSNQNLDPACIANTKEAAVAATTSVEIVATSTPPLSSASSSSDSSIISMVPKSTEEPTTVKKSSSGNVAKPGPTTSTVNTNGRNTLCVQPKRPSPMTGRSQAPPKSVRTTTGLLSLSKIALEILQIADSLRGSSSSGVGKPVSRLLVGLLQGTLHTSSGPFSTGLKQLRENGLLIVHTKPPRFEVTPHGVDTLISMNARVDPISCNEDVLDRVMTTILKKQTAKGLGRQIRLMFGVLARGQTLSRAELASASEQKTLQSGPSCTALKYMVDCKVVHYPRQGFVRMEDEMFPFGRPNLS